MALMKEFGGFKYLPSRLAERLRGVEIAVRRPMDGSHQGMHKSPAFGSSVEFAEYREYLPGDPVARIDWPVYARSDRYLIRQYHEDVSIRCFVLLDISESMSYQGDGPVSKMAYASTLAAGMMYLMVQQGDTVSLMTFDDRVRKFYEPAGTLPGLKPMLLGLEEIEAKRKGDIEAALHEAAGRLLSEYADMLRGRLAAGLPAPTAPVAEPTPEEAEQVFRRVYRQRALGDDEKAWVLKTLRANRPRREGRP